MKTEDTTSITNESTNLTPETQPVADKAGQKELTDGELKDVAGGKPYGGIITGTGVTGGSTVGKGGW